MRKVKVCKCSCTCQIVFDSRSVKEGECPSCRLECNGHNIADICISRIGLECQVNKYGRMYWISHSYEREEVKHGERIITVSKEVEEISEGHPRTGRRNERSAV
jgi:hypothetical protein